MLHVIEGDGRTTRPGNRSLLVMCPDGSAERVTRLPSGFHTEAVKRSKMFDAEGSNSTVRDMPSPNRLDQPPCPELKKSLRVVTFNNRVVVMIGEASFGLDRQGCVEFVTNLMLAVGNVTGKLISEHD